MKGKHIFWMCLIVGLLTFTNAALAYFCMLPIVPPSLILPYAAEKDHYSGPACVQMILNSCPSLSARHYHSQDDIYNVILSHNAEPTMWFSDPTGIEGALEDAVLSPCGNWVDYSNANKSYVMGKMLYYMKTQKYLTPVSIGDSEHWVTVFGYQSDVEPSSSTSTVTLLDIYFYDSLAANPSACIKSGTVWLSNSDYWGVPLNKPGSSWHNKYIAVIEPPDISIKVIAPKWVLRGRILPVERIERYFYRWLENVRERGVARGPFEILGKDIKMEKPILVKTAKYSYYLIPFKDRRLVAIFNAYNGSFEEFRYFKKPQRYILDRKTIKSRLSEILRVYKARIIKISTPTHYYDPELAVVGRFSLIWDVQVLVRDMRGKDHKLPISLNSAGQIIKGIREFDKVRRLKK